jgi:hypothetical protein
MTDEVRIRILAELERISTPQSQAKLFESPDAVVYFGLPSSLGIVDTTDVLVLVPSGYPGAMLDHAYLPADSKLLGIVKGQPEVVLVANGRNWQRVSYHPHNGGGGPPWDPTVHGFHTYIDELLSWLSVRR